MIISPPLFAASSCPQNKLLNSHEILECYLKEPENIPEPWTRLEKRQDETYKVSINTYLFSSQTWPKPEMSAHGILWQHALEMYFPEKILHHQALFFVTGGTRYSQYFKLPFYKINFARIAAATNSIVINLRDIPNQYLSFDDEKPRKEDSIIAYSWNRFLDNPSKNSYWPAHLPMTKAIIKAMDASQEIALKEANVSIDHFVVTGASKRGWATWLAALSDTRINAIVPVVIDILNMRDNLELIYNRYNKQWPPAFHDYVEEKIPDRLNTAEFESLIQVEDPLAYLNASPFYQQRLTIPKYIISASGDDFFVPDSLALYVNKLPGETLVRVVPNQSHFIDMRIVESALLSYYQSICQQHSRPHLQWTLSPAGDLVSVSTEHKPLSVKLWEAVNPENGDFRLAANIHYSATELAGNCEKGHCSYTLPVQPLAKGWRSRFVEVSFLKDSNESLILTTPAFVQAAK